MKTTFQHEARFYAGGLDGFAREIAPAVASTLEAGGSAAVAAPSDRLECLQALFDGAERLQLLDMGDIGVNPARIIPAWRALADQALASGKPFLGVGEPIWAGRTGPEIDECHRHEALINVAFGDDPPWRLICPYDVEGLDPAVVADARATHPTVVDHEQMCSERHVDGAAAFAALERPLAAAPASALRTEVTPEGLSTIRATAMRLGREVGLGIGSIADLVTAVTELAANSIRHGTGPGTLRMWGSPAGIFCETTNAGRILDPMVGRRRPDTESTSGRGVWIMHQLCDLVQIRETELGMVIRLQIRVGR